MSAKIVDIKKAIIDLLKADVTLQSLLSTDENGEVPVYHAFVSHKRHTPCVTVEDVTDQAEVSALNDGYDGSKRYQWQHAVIQIDCWSTDGPEERDRLQDAVQKCLLKNVPSGVIYCHEPLILALDKLDSKPLLWRKSLRFKVMYVMEVS